MTKPITHSHNFIPHNSQTTLKTNNEATSPKHIIQNIMYTPHQHAPAVSALQSKNKHSKQFAMYAHHEGHTPHSQLTKIKKFQGYKPSKFENNNNNNNKNETIKLIKSYSGSYNMSQIRSSNALAKVVSQVQKQPNNFFFLKKKISVNETLQKNHSHKIKMSYIQNQTQHNQNANHTQSNNTNANTHTQSMINADNNNTSLKHHSSNRNNNHNVNTNSNSNNTNNLVLIDNNLLNSNEHEKNLNSAHYNQCENSSKVPCNSALENYHNQGSSLCFLKSNNSDTIKTRKRFNKSKTRKKTQKFSPNHIAILNMKDVLDELQKEEKPIKICKTIHKQTVKSKEEQKENKTLILTTINDSSNHKGFLCKCIPFCINTHKLIK